MIINLVLSVIFEVCQIGHMLLCLSALTADQTIAPSHIKDYISKRFLNINRLKKFQYSRSSESPDASKKLSVCLPGCLSCTMQWSYYLAVSNSLFMINRITSITYYNFSTQGQFWKLSAPSTGPSFACISWNIMFRGLKL